MAAKMVPTLDLSSSHPSAMPLACKMANSLTSVLPATAHAKLMKGTNRAMSKDEL